MHTIHLFGIIDPETQRLVALIEQMPYTVAERAQFFIADVADVPTANFWNEN